MSDHCRVTLDLNKYFSDCEARISQAAPEQEIVIDLAARILADANHELTCDSIHSETNPIGCTHYRLMFREAGLDLRLASADELVDGFIDAAKSWQELASYWLSQKGLVNYSRVKLVSLFYRFADEACKTNLSANSHKLSDYKTQMIGNAIEKCLCGMKNHIANK